MAIANKSSNSEPFIAIPRTTEKLCMYVCFSQNIALPKNKSLVPIKICEVNPRDVSQMEQFINFEIFTFKEITKCPIRQFQVEPLEGLILTTPLNASKCVYKFNGMVYKLYDKMYLTDKEQQHIDFGISYLNPKKQTLSEDSRFYMLCYKYIEQKTREL